MSMLFNPRIIPQSNYNLKSNLGQSLARDSGPVSEYIYIESKPKKQLKELQKTLLPEKKKFLFIKYSYKFNLRTTCVICGVMHQWDISDPMRPPLPLSDVTKGRPLKGNYCPKHAGYYKQETGIEQYTRLMVDIQGKLVQIQKIIPILEMNENGEK